MERKIKITLVRDLQTTMERIIPAGTILIEGVCQGEVIPSDVNLAVDQGKVLIEELAKGVPAVKADKSK